MYRIKLIIGAVLTCIVVFAQVHVLGSLTEFTSWGDRLALLTTAVLLLVLLGMVADAFGCPMFGNLFEKIEDFIKKRS